MARPPLARNDSPMPPSPSTSPDAEAPVWLVSVRPRALRTSLDHQPLMSRSVITSRWRSGSPAIASSSTWRAASPASSPRGTPTPPAGAPRARVWPRRPWKRLGWHRRLVATLFGGRRSAANGSTRRSRSPRVRALLSRMLSHPGAQRRAALEAVDAVEHGQPRVLHDLLGDRPARNVHDRQAQQHRPPLLDQARRRPPRRRPAGRAQASLGEGRGALIGVMPIRAQARPAHIRASQQ